MSVLDAFLLFLAGFVSGAVNAVAGGGTFITFGALSLVGIAPISANATSSITQFPGYITSTLAYLDDIRLIWRGALALALVSAVGALAGALILLALDNPSFRAMVPWLLIAATALFAAGPWLKPKPKPGAEAAGRLARRLAGAVRDRRLWRLLRRRHGRDDAGDAWPDPGRRLSSAQRAEEPAVDRHRGRRHPGLRLGRRRRLAAGAGHGPGRGARRLCRRLGRQARAAERPCASSSSRSGFSWRSIIS